MQKAKLFDNLLIYTFDGKEEFNILVLANQGNALLIDTSFPELAKQAQSQLQTDGLIPKIIVNSHYHPDHINGNYIFAECDFMGSELYKQNFELFEALNPGIDFIKPKVLLKNRQTFNYGPFELQFLNLKGHCQDCLATVIQHPDFTAPIVHVADLLMFSNDGKHSIPYISYDGSVIEHIQSLETLRSMNIRILVPSHGIILKDQDQIREAIDKRIYYLQRLQELGKGVKVVDCLLGDQSQYNLLHLHERNLQNVFG